MPSEQIATEQSFGSRYRSRFRRRHDAARPVVAPAGATRGRDYLARFRRARRLLPSYRRGARRQARARRDRRRLPGPRPQPRPARGGQAIRRSGRRSLERPGMGCPPVAHGASVCAGALQWRPGRPAARAGGNGSIEGMVVSNPALRVAVPIAPAKLRLGRLLARVAPWVTLTGDAARASSLATRRFKRSIAPTRCATIASVRRFSSGWSRGASCCWPGRPRFISPS